MAPLSVCVFEKRNEVRSIPILTGNAECRLSPPPHRRFRPILRPHGSTGSFYGRLPAHRHGEESSAAGIQVCGSHGGSATPAGAGRVLAADHRQGRMDPARSGAELRFPSFGDVHSVADRQCSGRHGFRHHSGQLFRSRIPAGRRPNADQFSRADREHGRAGLPDSGAERQACQSAELRGDGEFDVAAFRWRYAERLP